MATPGTAAAQSLRTDEIQKVRSPGLGSLPAPDTGAARGACARTALPAPERSPSPGPAPAQMLEENYLCIKAIVENQNLGRLADVNQ
jgi:hypothetical protein